MMVRMTTADSPLEFDPDGHAIAETDAEMRLLAAVESGKFARIPGAPKPDQTNGWKDDHTIRAKFLRHLCLHPGRYEIDPRGIQLSGARITGTLDLRSATLHRPLWIDESRFIAAPILQDAATPTLALQDCHLPGLEADRLTVTGTLRFDGSSFSGEVCLSGATITGDLSCTKATFDNAGSTAFFADGLKCGGGVVLDSVTAMGETLLLGADITGDLDCEQAIFDNADGFAFNAERMSVHRRFYWRALARPPQGAVNFAHARVGDFVDDGSGWPEAEQLYIEGFQYENLAGDTTVHGRCNWLDRMPKMLNSAPVFWPQPYAQLVKVLRTAGHERDARLMAIAKMDAYRVFLKAQDGFQDDILRIKNTTPEVYRELNRDKDAAKILRPYATRASNFWRRAWYKFFEAVAGYGYEPWRAGYWLAGFWLVGTLIFGWAEAAAYMRPAKERITASAAYTLPQLDCEERGWRYVAVPKGSAPPPSSMCVPADYTAFHAVTYSLDILIPIVDLHQETFWEPSSAGWRGGFLRFWLWFQIIAGWVLTTVTVVGFTGVIKKD